MHHASTRNPHDNDGVSTEGMLTMPVLAPLLLKCNTTTISIQSMRSNSTFEFLAVVDVFGCIEFTCYQRDIPKRALPLFWEYYQWITPTRLLRVVLQRYRNKRG